MDEIVMDRILINRQIGIVEKRLREEGLSEETIGLLNQRKRELETELDNLKK